MLLLKVKTIKSKTRKNVLDVVENIGAETCDTAASRFCWTVEIADQQIFFAVVRCDLTIDI